ncbi:polysaccharide deacetylase [Apiospora hydei]|uniref:Polysaccharide deacetylase n=1 Tax=Apiospora hydei TaxID=1337664 RepID=A0ABR1W9R4_9PEZI
MMQSSLILGYLLGFIHTSYACSAERPSLSRRDVPAGGKCGPSAGNAVCAPSLCCSSAGVCGTGASYCSSPDCQLSFGPACDGNQVPPGSDTSRVPRPRFGSVTYGVSLNHCAAGTNGKVALTFDDGPYIYTSELLDLLKKNNVRATFFVVGNNGGKGQVEQGSYPAIIQRMYKDGHQIGSHSWSHQDLGAITPQQRRDQILRNEFALVDILGFFPTYFRPPYTSCPDGCVKDLSDLGYHIVNYDIDTKDYQGDYNYARNTYSSILSQHSPASSSWITLAHDIQPNTVQSFAQYMIDQAKKLGYELVPLGQCLGDPEANWYRNPTSGEPWGAKPASAGTVSAGSVSAALKMDNSSSTVPKSSTKPGSTRTLTGDPTPTPISGSSNFGMGTANTATVSGLQAAAPTSSPEVTHASDGSFHARVSISALVMGSGLALTLFLS